MTILSTTKTTRVVTVARATDTPSLTPAPITGSFTAIIPSIVSGSETVAPYTNSSTAVLPSILQPVASVAASSSGGIIYSEIFPSHTVTTNSSSAYAPPPATSSSSAAYSAPVYFNSTSITSSHSGHNFPTFIIGREVTETVHSTETVHATKTVQSTETAKSTETVTSTATGPAATTSKGMAGESQVSFVALFLGLMVAAQI
jgi:hypothetical protein